MTGILAGCGDDAPVDAGPRGQDGPASTEAVDDSAIDADAYVADVIAGRASGAATVGVPGGMLVYGGLVDPGEDGYEVLDTAVVVGPDGVQAEIATGIPLVEPSASLVGDERVLVVGRRCAQATLGDTGVTCEPATAAALVIDLAKATASPLEMPLEASDPTGTELFLTAVELGGRPVVGVSRGGEVEWWSWADDLTPGELLTTSAPTPAVCSTGQELVEVAAGGGPADLPMDASAWADAAEPAPITLRRFDTEAGTWTESEPSAAVARGSVQVACSADGVTVLVGDLATATTLAFVAGDDGTWRSPDGAVGSSVASAVAGPTTADVLVVDVDGTAVLLSPDSLALRQVVVDESDPADALTLVEAIGAEGFGRLAGGPPAVVELIS